MSGGMLIPPGLIRVLVATKLVDFHKGMDGLAALVKEQLKDRKTFEHLESSEQRRCCMALVVVGHRAGPFLHWRARLGGWVRSRAWICATSSTERKMAWAGGST
jgi:hypothetical protein